VQTLLLRFLAIVKNPSSREHSGESASSKVESSISFFLLRAEAGLIPTSVGGYNFVRICDPSEGLELQIVLFEEPADRGLKIAASLSIEGVQEADELLMLVALNVLAETLAGVLAI
jgi:hypothetical protein